MIAELTISMAKVCQFSKINSFLVHHNCHQIIATFSRKFDGNCSLWLTSVVHNSAHEVVPCQAQFRSKSNIFHTFLAAVHSNKSEDLFSQLNGMSDKQCHFEV